MSLPHRRTVECHSISPEDESEKWRCRLVYDLNLYGPVLGIRSQSQALLCLFEGKRMRYQPLDVDETAVYAGNARWPSIAVSVDEAKIDLG